MKTSPYEGGRRFLCGRHAILLLALLYLLTLPRAHLISDSHQWIGSIRQDSLRQQLHPHHLLYTPVVDVLHRPLLKVGLSDWTAIQLLSVLAAVAGLSALSWTLHRLTGDDALTFWGTLAYGSAFSAWLFAVEVEVYGPAAAFLVIAFALLVLATESESARRFLAVGAMCGVAGLFHQTACFFLAPVVVAGLASAGVWRHRLLRGASGITGFGLTAGTPYVLAATLVERVESPQAFFHWMTTHAQRGFANGYSLQTPVRTAVGFGRSLIYGSPLVNALREGGSAASTSAVFIAAGAMLVTGGVVATVLILGLRHMRGLSLAQRNLLGLAGVWLLAHGAFSAYYEPQNIEWWAIPMVPTFVALALLAHAIPRARGRQLLAALALALLIGNLTGDFIPRRNPDFDPYHRAARRLEAHAGPDGLVLAPSLVIPRLQSDYVSLYIAVRNNPERLDLAVGLLVDRVEQTLAAGGSVAMLERILGYDKLRYHANARPLLEGFARLAEAHAEMVGAVTLPLDNDREPLRLAPAQTFRIYRLQPGSTQARDWLSAARDWQQRLHTDEPPMPAQAPAD